MKIGIIGGGEIVDRDNDIKSIDMDTPYGKPTALILSEKIGNHEIFVLSRHGRPHTVSPTDVNYRANIYAMKELGVKVILGPTACGSLTRDYQIGDVVLPDQLIDFTKNRINTFNSKDQLKHVSMADPFCKRIRESLYETIKKLNISGFKGGTLVSIEGPAFSTRAESHMYRLLGGSLINMTTATEAKLAREIGLCYQPISLVTDMDCWDENEKPVTLRSIFENIKTKAPNVVRTLIRNWVFNLEINFEYEVCTCSDPEDTIEY